RTQVRERLQLQIAFGQALMAAKGYGASETTAAFARARELAAEIEDATERFSVYYGLWVGSFIRGELALMQELATSFLREVEDRPELPEAVSAYRVFGLTCYFAGELAAARANLERAVALSDVERDRALSFRFGQEPGTAAMLNLALMLAMRGEVDQAHRLLDQAATQARQGGHLPTIAYMHGQACFVEGVCHDAARTMPHARMLSQLRQERGLQLWVALATF